MLLSGSESFSPSSSVSSVVVLLLLLLLHALPEFLWVSVNIQIGCNKGSDYHLQDLS